MSLKYKKYTVFSTHATTWVQIGTSCKIAHSASFYIHTKGAVEVEFPMEQGQKDRSGDLVVGEQGSSVGCGSSVVRPVFEYSNPLNPGLFGLSKDGGFVEKGA
jgi:hypothetical protein